MKPLTIDQAVLAVLGFENPEELINSDPINFHHSTGRQIRNDWDLWNDDTPLHKEFNSIKIFHADDMSGIILETAKRILMQQPIDLKGQVEKYLKYWSGKGIGLSNLISNLK